MQEIYNFILSQEIYNLGVMLFTVCYGIPFGLGNLCCKFRGLFRNKTIRQSELGQALDVVWLVAIFWSVIVLFK